MAQNSLDDTVCDSREIYKYSELKPSSIFYEQFDRDDYDSSVLDWPKCPLVLRNGRVVKVSEMPNIENEKTTCSLAPRESLLSENTHSNPPTKTIVYIPYDPAMCRIPPFNASKRMHSVRQVNIFPFKVFTTKLTTPHIVFNINLKSKLFGIYAIG